MESKAGTPANLTPSKFLAVPAIFPMPPVPFPKNLEEVWLRSGLPFLLLINIERDTLS